MINHEQLVELAAVAALYTDARLPSANLGTKRVLIIVNVIRISAPCNLRP
jgi:hypothetical protein